MRFSREPKEITADVEVILAGGTAAVAFGQTSAEELTAQYRAAVLAAVR